MVESVDNEAGSPSGESAIVSQDDFNARVKTLVEMIEGDPAIRDRMLCEMYVTLAEFSASFRGMMGAMEEMGPSGFIKLLMQKGV